MNFEEHIKHVTSIKNDTPNEIGFLDRLHLRHENEMLKKHHVMASVAAFGLILLTGLLTFARLDNIAENYATENANEIDNVYIDELALSLLDYDEDVWGIVEFLDEVNHEPITTIVEASI